MPNGRQIARLVLRGAAFGTLNERGFRMRFLSLTNRFVLTAALAILAASTAPGAELKDFAGTWVMRLGDRHLFVLTLTPADAGMRGTFERPAKFHRSNGIFAGIEGAQRDKVLETRLADGVLHLTIQNANDSQDRDGYAMTLKGNRAELIYDDVPSTVVQQPFVFERAPAGATVATDWDPCRAYAPEDSDTPNAEMKAIFDDDQKVRTAPQSDGQAMSRTDAERRGRTRKLLAAGALHTGKDFEEAAFVFQHGDTPADYLLAHTLAMVAVAKGDSMAIWIAAATLDRYLQRIGQRQILGTQYLIGPDHRWTQEPYDRELVSEALRGLIGVPSQALQGEQLKIYQAQQ